MIYSLCPEVEVASLIDRPVPTGYVKVVAMSYDDEAPDLSLASDWTTSFVCVEGYVKVIPVGLADLLYEDQVENPDGEWNISAA